MSENKTKPVKTFTQEDLQPTHDAILKKMAIPDWMGDFKCTQCESQMSTRQIRGIRLAMNAHHMRDFIIELMCDKCKATYDLHAREACRTLADFIKIISSDQNPNLDLVPGYEIPNSANNLIYYVTDPDKEI